MKSFLLLVIVLLVFSCTGEEFSPDKWTGGDNELIVELSESTISLRDYKTCVDTIFISTNGTDWDFQVDSSATWCRCAKIDSMLLFFIDENTMNMPRMARILVTGYYNHVTCEEVLSVVQPAAHFSNSGDIAVEPFMTFEYRKEWDNYMEPINWSFTDEVCTKILSELGLNGVMNNNFADLVNRKILIIKGFNVNGTYTSNLLYDGTSVNGYWFRENGIVANYGDAHMCCEFRTDDLGNVMYDKGSIYLHPSNIKNQDAQYCSYYIFSCGDKQVVLKWVLNVEAYNDLRIVKQLNLQHDVYANPYDTNPSEPYNYKFQTLQDSIQEIEELIGGEINTVQVYRTGNPELPIDNPLHYAGYIDYSKLSLQFGDEGLIDAPESYCTILLKDNGTLHVSLRSVTDYLYGLQYPERIISKWKLGSKLTGRAVEVIVDLSISLQRSSDKQYFLSVSIPSRKAVDYEVYNDNLYDEFFKELDAVMMEISEEYGAPIDVIYMNKYDDQLGRYLLCDGYGKDYWFGENGVATWGTEECLFHLNPMKRTAFKHHLDSYPKTARCVMNILNKRTSESTDINIVVNIE